MARRGTTGHFPGTSWHFVRLEDKIVAKMFKIYTNDIFRNGEGGIRFDFRSSRLDIIIRVDWEHFNEVGRYRLLRAIFAQGPVLLTDFQKLKCSKLRF